ncbi:MAG: hopanoid biosynthesis-associated protein HpnK [Rhodovarius sp.]|nr:hopanoid biosynthesis-associated protein HpnK [Rhodovarius sp.]MDW8314099.1 hopanoid biosynthesis-associated protein HpnK [Rhodovarius sp.]
MSARLIITADDFGLHESVNDAIALAHEQGVLTAASLMVGAPAAEHAIALARRLPGLAVGLHVTLTDGVPVLPARLIPSLTRRDGRFRDDMAGLGLLLALSREARAELHAEVLAQIERFLASGLTPDHVNAHKHFHLHPVIAASVMQAAAGAGIRCLRLPQEEEGLIGTRRSAGGTIRNGWCRILRRRAAAWGMRAPDRVIGLAWSGAFTADRLRSTLARLPPGVTELYFHPATRDDVPGGAPGYRYREELAALTDPEIRAAVAGCTRGGYRAMLGLAEPPPSPAPGTRAMPH